MSGATPVDEDDGVGRFLVLGAFGETIFRFQLIELSFWTILAARLKHGTNLDQGLSKVSAWDAQTMGRLVGVLGLPEDLKEEADQAVAARNYLVHRFMRDRAMLLHDRAFCEHVAEELAHVNLRLDEFEARLDSYIAELGVPQLTDDELEQLGLATPPSPAEGWMTDGA